eukprot:gene5454-4331_t
MSPNFPSDYGNDERCEIAAVREGMLAIDAFNTESGYDELTIDSQAYSGDS